MMNCRHCDTELATLEEFIFFVKDPKNVGLSLAPEKMEIVIKKSFNLGPEKKMSRDVICKHCDSDVGKETRFSPSGSSRNISFSTRKIKLFGHSFSKSDKWANLMKDDRFTNVERRGEEDYFKTVLLGLPEGGRSGEEFVRPNLPVKFPDPNISEDFSWSGLLKQKTARDYQLECYLQALQQDLVAVLPTGKGKTLIACLLLHKLRLFNPEKMGLFIVDRIPLVFQQQQVIIKETGLRVVGMTGMNKTKCQLKRLHTDEADVLVATAGLVESLLAKNFLFLEMFSCIVMDEAHHSSGKHIYTTLLDRVFLLPESLKPRLLGLTASPLQANSIAQAESSLKDISKAFKTNTIYRPDTDTGGDVPIEPEYIVISRTEKQKEFQMHFIQAYNKIAKTFNDELPESASEMKMSLKNEVEYSSMKGDIKAARELSKDGRKDKLLNVLEILLDTQEIVSCMGIRFGAEVLRELREKLEDHFPVEHYARLEEVSPRLEQLCLQLNECSQESKTLVFVQTRETASRLKRYLVEKYPHLNPNLAVGHGGHDGQHWSGDQEKIIKSFRKGECKLLVSTSVLEEGIDVQECDLVIRYSGVVTLIQYIQSRGRARKSGSKFIVLDEQQGIEKAKNMEKQEDLMNLVLKRHADTYNVLTDRTKQIFMQLKGDIKDGPLYSANLPENYWQANAIIEFFVCVDEVVDQEKMKEEFEECLEEYGIEVERIIVQPGIARQSSNMMFGFNDLMVLLQVTDENMIYETVQNLITGWNFQLSGNIPVFSKLNIKETSKDDNLLEWKLSGMGAGILDRQTFSEKYKVTQDITLRFKKTGKSISISFKEENISYELELSLLKMSIQGFASACWSEKVCEIFIPIETMPVLRSQTESSSAATRVTKHDLLTNLSSYPVISLKIHLDTLKEHILLREIFDDSFIFPLTVYDSRIQYKEEEEEDIKCDIPIPYELSRRKELLEDEWEVYIKLTNMIIHPRKSDANKYINRLRQAYQTNKTIEEENENTFANQENCVREDSLDSAEHPEDKKRRKVDNLPAENILAKQISTAVRLVSREGSTYWSSFDSLVENQLKKIQGIDRKGSLINIGKPVVSKYQTSVLRLVVTPTRYFFPPSVPMQSSRLSRMLCKEYGLIIVSFRDENLEKCEINDDIKNRVSDCLNKGIDLFGHKIFWLCSSASQLREMKAFFVEANSMEEVLALRQKIIPRPEVFDSSAKYLSRLGLFATSDRSAGFLKISDFEEIEDLYARNGQELVMTGKAPKHCVTDGAGFIKESFATELFKRCEYDTIPSAFQFRCMGLKGVLVVLPDDHYVFQGRTANILYRDSQKKFDTDHLEMGIVKAAKFQNVKLNRESITLLESLSLAVVEVKDKWSFPQIIVEHQEAYLDKISDILEKKEDAESILTQYVESSIINKAIESNFNIVREPFFFRLLRCVHKITISDLCKRANLHIQDGCLAMGIPDYANKLTTGQVFLQICKEGQTPQVIIGTVIIYRNPCLHPGDIRRVEAVDIPELHYSRNVLVLPTTNSDYSLAESCSGGDLDGDHFSVIWDKDYIPPVVVCQEPLDYSDLGGEPMRSDIATRPEELTEFFINCLENDTLGKVAHMHLALADIVDKGAMDKNCKELAKSQAVAVDFPKTGIRPQVPEEGLKTVRREGYPDFMEKRGETYSSKKVQGELYRNCKSFLFTYDLDEADKRKIPFDKAMKLDIPDDLMRKAEGVYEYYCIEMKRLMNQFSLKQEEEVILGRAVVWHRLLDSDRDKASEYLKEAYRALKEKFQRIFRQSTPIGEDKIWASAWYRVAYDQNKEYKDRPFLSFPWIAAEWLCQIKKDTFSVPELTNIYIDRKLGSSGFRVLEEESDTDPFNLNRLRAKLVEKQEMFTTVKTQILKKCGTDLFHIKPYGSSSILLCEEFSDLDICIQIHKDAGHADLLDPEFFNLDEVHQSRHILNIYVAQAVDEIYNWTDLISNEVPLLKGEMGNNLKIDISCNKNGLMKTRYILSLYCLDVAYFLAFWVLVRWARYSSIIKFQGFQMDDSLLETATFYAFIIKLLETEKQEDLNINEEVENLPLPELLDFMKEKILKEINDGEESKTEFFCRSGRLIHKFFRHAQTLSTATTLELPWPVDGIEPAYLETSKVSTLKKLCAQGLHVILFSRDVEELINNAKDCTMTSTVIQKPLSLSLSNQFRPCREFWMRRLSSITNAKVTISEEIGDARLIFRAEGPRKALTKALNELTNLNNNSKAFTLGIPPKRASRYFMAGSTIMTVHLSKEYNCKIGFSDSRGNYQPQHKVKQRSSPKLMYSDRIEQEEWIGKIAGPELEKKLKSQMSNFPLEKEHLKRNLEITSRYGTSYTIDVESRLPKTRVSIPMDEFIDGLEKGKYLRKKIETDFPKAQQPRRDDKERPIKMIELKTGKNKKTLEGGRPAKMKEADDKKKGISISFLPGVFNPDVAEIPKQVEKSREIFKKTLEDLGYEKGKNDLHRINQDSYWVFNVTAFTGYELQLIFDGEFNFIELKERNLSHVHATFLHGEIVEETRDLFIPHTDLRLIVQSAEPVLPGSNLFKTVFGESCCTTNPPVELNMEGKPRIKDGVDRDIGRSIMLAKHSEKIELYKKGDITASIITGKFYAGEGLKDEREYCDISLYFLPEHLVQAIHDNTKMKELSMKYLEESTKVSNKLNENIREFNEKEEKEVFHS